MGEGSSHKCPCWLRNVMASIRYGNGRGRELEYNTEGKEGGKPLWIVSPICLFSHITSGK